MTVIYVNLQDSDSSGEWEYLRGEWTVSEVDLHI